MNFQKRGEAEEACLTKVKNLLYSENEILAKKTSTIINNPASCLPLKWGDKHEIIKKSYFGIGAKEQETFENVILNCKANPKSSEFPDFLCSYGIIEHFLVSSSECVGKKGSMQLRNDANAEKRLNLLLEDAISKDTTNNGVEIITKHVDCEMAKHSYDNFKMEFYRCWNHHLNSLNNYLRTNQTTVCVFMIEYPDGLLKVNEIRDSSIPFNYKWGGLEYSTIVPKGAYRLAYDVQLLRYIERYKHLVQYVIFTSRETVDIICTEQINNIIKFIPNPLHIHSPIGFKQITGIVLPAKPILIDKRDKKAEKEEKTQNDSSDTPEDK